MYNLILCNRLHIVPGKRMYGLFVSNWHLTPIDGSHLQIKTCQETTIKATEGFGS